MNKYLSKLEAALGAKRAAARLSHIFGDDAPAPTAALVKKEPFSLKTYLADASKGAAEDVKDGIGTVVGAGVGLVAGVKYGRPIVGTIGGASLGRNLPALLDENMRSKAGRNLVVTGTAIAASTVFGGSPVRRAIGFGLGYVVASLATFFAGWGEK